MSIICNSRRYIFVHVPKCAGTSISYYLSPSLRVCDVSIGGDRLGEHIAPAIIDRFGVGKHATAFRIRNAVGHDFFRAYFTFGFVRNPFDRTLSIYDFLRKWLPTSSQRSFAESFNRFRSVNDFVASSLWLEPGPDRMLMPQHYFLGAPKRPIVDFVGRVETIDVDMAKLKSRVAPDLPVFSVRANATAGADGTMARRRQLNAHSIDRIVERYADDFNTFGYSTDPETALSPASAPR